MFNLLWAVLAGPPLSKIWILLCYRFPSLCTLDNHRPFKFGKNQQISDDHSPYNCILKAAELQGLEGISGKTAGIISESTRKIGLNAKPCWTMIL